MTLHVHVGAIAALLCACAGGPEPVDRDDGPGPMRPHAPDHELDAAAPIDAHDEEGMRAWIAERVAAARAGRRERVRLPVTRHGPFGCDCPPFAIGWDTDNGPFYWVAIVDLTSAGIPPGVWLGWVDGRFTGEVSSYRSTDEGGGEVATPVIEVLRQSRRTSDEPFEARVVKESR